MDKPIAFGSAQPDDVAATNHASGSIINQNDMLQRFGERELVKLTDRTKVNAIVAEVLQKAIDDAEAEVWGYLAVAGFRQPFAKPPHALVIRTCDVARWYLYENGIPEVVQTRYDAAIAWFKLLMKNPSMLGFDVDDIALDAAKASTMFALPNKLEEWKDVKSSF